MTTVHEVTARNVRRLREARGWRQADLAARMSEQGFAWSGNRVAQVETLRARLDLDELAGLCHVLDAPLAELLAGGRDERVDLSAAGQSVPLENMRLALREGRVPALDRIRRVLTDASPEPESYKAAARLGVDVERVEAGARRLWGHSLARERDRRAGDLSGLSKRSAQAKRGHVTRQLIDELDAAMEKGQRR